VFNRLLVVFCCYCGCYCGCLEFFLLVFKLLPLTETRDGCSSYEIEDWNTKQSEISSYFLFGISSYYSRLLFSFIYQLFELWIDCQLQLCFSIYSFLNSKLIKDIAVFFYLMLLPSFILYDYCKFFFNISCFDMIKFLRLIYL
jgi:hypothetical protein